MCHAAVIYFSVFLTVIPRSSLDFLSLAFPSWIAFGHLRFWKSSNDRYVIYIIANHLIAWTREHLPACHRSFVASSGMLLIREKVNVNCATSTLTGCLLRKRYPVCSHFTTECTAKLWHNTMRDLSSILLIPANMDLVPGIFPDPPSGATQTRLRPLPSSCRTFPATVLDPRSGRDKRSFR